MQEIACLVVWSSCESGESRPIFPSNSVRFPSIQAGYWLMSIFEVLLKLSGPDGM